VLFGLALAVFCDVFSEFLASSKVCHFMQKSMNI
jgi:hypothetical protein